MFLGSVMSSEKTAAAAGTVGELRFDPFAMLPFCGYNMADYFAHWLKIGRHEGAKLPKIFYVNWFRKDEDGRFLWPGFGENSRVLAWVFARCAGHGAANETPIGLIPPVGGDGIDTRGVDVSDEHMAELLRVDAEEWKAQLPQFREHLAQVRPASRRAQPAARRARAAPGLGRPTGVAGASAVVELAIPQVDPLRPRTGALGLVTRFALTKPGTWLFSEVAARIDPWLMRRSSGRVNLAAGSAPGRAADRTRRALGRRADRAAGLLHRR